MKVDVLAVMDRLIGNTRTMAGLTGDTRLRDYHLAEGEKARAAIAELIEAHKELRARYVSLFDLYQRPTYHESSSPDDDLNLALARTDAALAKVQ